MSGNRDCVGATFYQTLTHSVNRKVLAGVKRCSGLVVCVEGAAGVESASAFRKESTDSDPSRTKAAQNHLFEQDDLLHLGLPAPLEPGEIDASRNGIAIGTPAVPLYSMFAGGRRPGNQALHQATRDVVYP